MASAFNVFLAGMWIERNIRGATLHRKQKQKQMKKNKMLSDAKKVLYLVLMFACSGPAYAGIVKGIASKIVEAGFCGMTFWTVPLFAICLCGGRMPLRPYIFTIDSLGDAVKAGIGLWKFFAKNCRGVSHTPWCGRIGNDGGEQSIVIPWKSPLPDLFAYVEGVCPCAPT